MEKCNHKLGDKFLLEIEDLCTYCGEYISGGKNGN